MYIILNKKNSSVVERLITHLDDHRSIKNLKIQYQENINLPNYLKKSITDWSVINNWLDNWVKNQ
jgi:hypothetical protein